MSGTPNLGSASASRSFCRDRLIRGGLAAVLTAAVAAWLAFGITSASGVPAAGQPSAPTHLVFRRFGVGVGVYDFTLGCDPVAGDLPDRGAGGAGLARDPALVTTRPGAGHSCPFGGGMRISGTFEGTKVQTIVSDCFYGLGNLVAAWSKLLPPVPRFPLEVEAGHAFTPGLVLSHGRSGFRLRYRHGARFALEFPVKNLSSSPLTITSIEGLATTAPQTGSLISYPNTPQLVVPIGATLTLQPTGSSGQRPPLPPLSPVTTRTPAGLTFPAGATIDVQEDFALGSCGSLKPGTIYVFNRQIPLSLQTDGAGGGEWIPDLPANWITIVVPANCTR
ncbi:MAG: hypothetical protein ACRD6W_05010 [Nitrososphaerales archaeon]